MIRINPAYDIEKSDYRPLDTAVRVWLIILLGVYRDRKFFVLNLRNKIAH